VPIAQQPKTDELSVMLVKGILVYFFYT